MRSAIGQYRKLNALSLKARRATYDNGTRPKEARILARDNSRQHPPVSTDGQSFANADVGYSHRVQEPITTQSYCATPDAEMIAQSSPTEFLSSAAPVCVCGNCFSASRRAAIRPLRRG